MAWGARGASSASAPGGQGESNVDFVCPNGWLGRGGHGPLGPSSPKCQCAKMGVSSLLYTLAIETKK